MDHQSKGVAPNRSSHVVDTNAAPRPQYIENVWITIDRVFEPRGFAFGSATIGKERVEVFVALSNCATQDANGWCKVPPEKRIKLYDEDVIFARVKTSTEPGKKPSAVVWKFVSHAFDDIGVDDDFGPHFNDPY